jgi:murein DD-endopeptidase MepM/ murein hydrolase activator NlpD
MFWSPPRISLLYAVVAAHFICLCAIVVVVTPVGAALANVQAPAGSPKFLSLPFNDASVVLRQGWYYDGPGAPPLTCPRANGDIGSRRTHCGIDYFKGSPGNRVGFDVRAAAPGRAAWFPSLRGLGNTIIIVHDEIVNGRTFCTRYGHLANRSSLVPATGWTRVERGAVIGRAGASVGPGDPPVAVHLHFDVLTFSSTSETDLCNPPSSPRFDPYDIAEALIARNIEPTYVHYPGRESTIGSADVPVQTCGTNSLWIECPGQPQPPVFAGPNACTNLVSRGTAIPSGYGSPVNLFANDRNLLFEAVCRGGDTVEIQAGHNYPQQYTYRYGYRWTGQQWQRFEFTGAQRRGEWLVGQATVELDRRQLNASGNNWIVGYSCWLLPSGEWRCGCADTACARGVWQVQGFLLSPQSAVSSWNAVAGTWRGNVVQPGARPYTATFKVDASGPGARCGTIDYPELSCGGDLRNCRLSNGAYLFDEALTYGRLQCVANGTISVRPRDSRLDWQWTYPSGRVGSTAVLTRQ